ncbi:hypothetical protein [Polyangium spumosum]|uniref:PQQ-binding-like beta-propeller repeat protein n=1 Tax=Polyangium spumosum TaxID=889282 RepID=A0A6N7PPT4_9BACT|nr:hypothetical protein [Polyangium spumosum]MRG94212.1 hypothetical protein [Polyangium spumosum]
MVRRRRTYLRLAAVGLVSLFASALPSACALDVYGSFDPDAPCIVGVSARCYTGPAATAGVGLCVPGAAVCRIDQTFGACVGEVVPQEENCFTPEDEDCDGEGRGDDECLCDPGATLPCETGKLGACAAGVRTCEPDGLSFGACVPEASPSAEDCATEGDEDCDGVAPGCAGDVELGASRGGDLSDVAFGVATNGLVHATAGVLDGDVQFRTVNSGKLYVDRRVASLAMTWSREFAAEGGRAAARGVAVAGDSADVIVAGDFQGSMDFGNGKVLTSAANGVDALVVAVDAAGGVRWAKAFGDGDVQAANAVAAGPHDRIAVAGEVAGTVDFGGGAQTSTGDADLFVAVLDPAGERIWSRLYGDAAAQRAHGVAFVDGGDVVVAGDFDGQLDLGGGVVLPAGGGGDAFVARLSGVDTNAKWGVGIGDAQSQHAYAVAVGPSGEVAVTGAFSGSIVLSGVTLTSATSLDAFLLVFEPDGALRFGKSLGDTTGGDQIGMGVAFDAAGNVIVTGGFDGSIDLGAGPVVSAGSADVFIAKYAGADGALLWARTDGDAEAQRGFGVVVLPDSRALVTGAFAGTLDFGPPLSPLVSKGALDVFVTRFSP